MVRSDGEFFSTICKEIHAQAWDSCNSLQSQRPDQRAGSTSWRNFTADFVQAHLIFSSSSSTEVSRRRTSVGDPAIESCEAHNISIDAFGDFLCWFPDAAARLKGARRSRMTG